IEPTVFRSLYITDECIYIKCPEKNIQKIRVEIVK
ncbi:unnamed protein product, partial [marine sediment metagenome]